MIITFLISVCLSVCLCFRPSARSSSSPTEQNFLNIGVLLLICMLQFQIWLNQSKRTGTLEKDLLIFIILCCAL